MVAPLKAGLAGLGTVGSAVVRLIAQQRDLIETRCGRGIEVVAVTARTPDKTRDLGEAQPRWVSDPATLAADAGIDVFVELMGGDGDPAKLAVTTALAA
jgi:homoserine dehydrogenase